jgi:hypothetical protein
MSNMVADFNSKDLCRIIEACNLNGVTKLKFGDVEITFGPVATLDLPKISPQIVYPEAREDQTPDKMSPIQKDLLEEARTSQLLVDDPVAFEQEMIDGFMGTRRVSEYGDIEDR